MSTSNDPEKLRDRIRRLLALAESANVNEAATAAAMAQALMARHRIEAATLDAEVDAGFEDFRDEPLEASKRLRPWKVELAAVVARANGCRIYLLDRGRDDAIVPVGRREDVALVRVLYDELVKRVESLTRKFGEGRDRAFCNGFRLGVVVTLDERLRLANESARERALRGEVDVEADAAAEVDEAAETRAESVGLAVRRLAAREEAVDRFLEKKLGPSSGKTKSLRADAEGYARGRLAGQTLAIEGRKSPSSRARR